jgi:hypothetical protein
MIINKGMFDKTFDIEIEGVNQKITLKPLPAKYLNDLLVISNELQIKSTGNDEQDSILILDKLSNSDIMSKLIVLETETIKRSYPEWDADTVNDFVTVNAFKLLPLVVKVNFRSKDDK